MITAEELRRDFPILETSVHGRKLVYLDNAATMQCPEPVLKAVCDQYHNYHANIHRGIHYLSESSTLRIEQVREKTASFIGAQESCEVIFTSGTTQSINMVARSFGDTFIRPGDHILTTQMEHHSNLIPWQQLCKRTGAVLDVVSITNKGDLDMDELMRLLKARPVLAAVTCVSNVLGTVNPVEQIIEMAHEAGTSVLLDGAQAMRHGKVDVSRLNCDFFCFSGHKMGAPTGTGVLYGKKEWLRKLDPVLLGGGMISAAGLQSAAWEDLPLKFEAGTQNIAGIIGLGAAVDYLSGVGTEKIAAYEEQLLELTAELLQNIPSCVILGEPERRAGCLSFYMDGIHSYDLAIMLDRMGIALRTGHHCARPLLERFGLGNVLRVSPAFYNTVSEIEYMADALKKAAQILK